MRKKTSKLLIIEGFGHYRISSICGISEPYPLDGSNKLYGIEIYLKSGHTTLLRDANPEFLLAVRNIISTNMLLEENQHIRVADLGEQATIEIRKVAPQQPQQEDTLGELANAELNAMNEVEVEMIETAKTQEDNIVMLKEPIVT